MYVYIHLYTFFLHLDNVYIYTYIMYVYIYSMMYTYVHAGVCVCTLLRIDNGSKTHHAPTLPLSVSDSRGPFVSDFDTSSWLTTSRVNRCVVKSPRIQGIPPLATAKSFFFVSSRYDATICSRWYEANVAVMDPPTRLSTGQNPMDR